MKLFEKIEKNLSDLHILPVLENCGTVVCALSGGADSTVLLHFLHFFLPSLGVGLVAAHLNHCIRGSEADADEAFCRSLCEKLEIPFYTRRTDVPALAKAAGLGLEECARKQRYAFLEEIRASLPGAVIATAHNATDHLETVLFHLARGTGAKGLCGISPTRDGYIVRPLLCCTAEEVRSFAGEQHIAYVIDKTNDDPVYTRNYIRKEIIPALRKINPRCDDAALRMSRLLSEDLTYLEDAAAGLLSPGGFLDKNVAACAPPPLLSRAVLAMYREFTGTLENLSGAHLSDCMTLIFEKNAGRISLPGKVALFSQGERIWIGADPAFTVKSIPDSVPLPVGQTVFFGSYLIKASKNQVDIVPPAQNIYNLAIYGTLDFDKINNSLFIRVRFPGDTYFSGGMHKKLKKLFSALKIPAHLRDSFPLICDGSGIIWVPGLRPRDGCEGLPSVENPVYIGVWRADME